MKAAFPIFFYQSGFSEKGGDFRPLEKTEKTKWIGRLTSVNWWSLLMVACLLGGNSLCQYMVGCWFRSELGSFASLVEYLNW